MRQGWPGFDPNSVGASGPVMARESSLIGQNLPQQVIRPKLEQIFVAQCR